MQESLLSHIANNFISEYENVANSSIAYLLNRYVPAREVLQQIINVKDVPSYFVTELATKSNGRPDVTGLDVDGNKAVIIEGKFWANLTDNQPNNYLKELSENGKLLFLAPEKRLSSLEIDIRNRLNGTEDGRISVCSWSKFLNLIEIENNKNHDHNLASDLIQLKQLCGKMDEEGMPPLSMSSLDPMNGKLAWEFADLIDECNSLLRKSEHTDFKGLNITPRKSEYGFYFKAFDVPGYLGVSNYDWFTRASHTPIWLTMNDKDFSNPDQIYSSLNNFDAENSYHDKGRMKYGITLETGMDKNQIVNHVVNQALVVLEAISFN